MSDTAKFKLNLKSGEVEIEGSEAFVERQIEQLESLVEALGLRANISTDEQAGSEAAPSNSDFPPTTDSPNKEDPPPASFGEWLHSFRTDINDLDKALITARYVQSQSAQNDFKTSEVNKSLKEHGIKLSNPSSSLNRLGEKKLMFQTRKVGSLKFMRVSTDGQKHLESLKRHG